MPQGLSHFEARVLGELAQIREDCKTRLAVLETHDRETYGNGQPGWKEKHEARLGRLEKVVYSAIGGAGAVWGIVKVMLR